MRRYPILKARQFNLKLNRTLIMGVVNITPDSFSDGGKFLSAPAAIRHAKKLISEGADIIDIGAESTRPGSIPVEPKEQIRRLKPVLKFVVGLNKVPVSVDTYSYETAEFALQEGASIINYINGAQLSRKFSRLIARFNAAIFIMHMKGSPLGMQKNPRYKNVVKEVCEALRKSARLAVNCQVNKDSIAIDPGIGFGKGISHNLEIIRNIGSIKKDGFPVVIGCSRKSFIGKITGKSEGSRLYGSIAAAVISAANGADIIRVHDVRQSVDAIKVADAISAKTEINNKWK